ncbi:MAG: hypothetical protein KM310_06605 [Clostridiales bacterium]|nr:hypothetical protein [Clostridiales bacterium]
MKAPVIQLLKSVWRKQLLEFSRYWVQTVGDGINTLIVVLAVLLGVRLAGSGSPTLGNTLDALVVTLFLWVIGMYLMSSFSWDLVTEANWGTLEQLMMSPYDFRLIAVFRAAGTLFLYAFEFILILGLGLLVTGRTLTLDFLTILPLLLLVVVAGLGVGLFVAGIALIHKRIQSVINLLQWVVLSLVMAPVGLSPLFLLPPMSAPAALIREAMTQGTRLFQFPETSLALAAGLSLLYFALGWFFFGLQERKARQGGLLAQY